MTDIRFYRANGEHGWASCLFRRPMVFEGETFDCAERAYQAGPGGKARKPQVRAWLLAAPSPALCAMAAHGLYHWDIRTGWSRDRRPRMLNVLRAKADQHADIADWLEATGTARIVECGTVDNEVNRRWGEVNGRGQNWLGLGWMQVREERRKATP